MATSNSDQRNAAQRNTEPRSQAAPRNEVSLIGRISTAPEERELPSGDVLITWRVVVDRAPSRRPLPDGIRPTTYDTVDCVAWTPGLLRAAAGWSVGDVLELEGALRRRFWQSPVGPQSKTEVEVLKAKRLLRAA